MREWRAGRRLTRLGIELASRSSTTENRIETTMRAAPVAPIATDDTAWMSDPTLVREPEPELAPPVGGRVRGGGPRIGEQHTRAAIRLRRLRARTKETDVECMGFVQSLHGRRSPHSSATHLFECGSDIRTVQQLLGCKGMRTPMIYNHALNLDLASTQRPLDRFPGTANHP